MLFSQKPKPTVALKTIDLTTAHLSRAIYILQVFTSDRKNQTFFTFILVSKVAVRSALISIVIGSQLRFCTVIRLPFRRTRI